MISHYSSESYSWNPLQRKTRIWATFHYKDHFLRYRDYTRITIEPICAEYEWQQSQMLNSAFLSFHKMRLEVYTYPIVKCPHVSNSSTQLYNTLAGPMIKIVCFGPSSSGMVGSDNCKSNTVLMYSTCDGKKWEAISHKMNLCLTHWCLGDQVIILNGYNLQLLRRDWAIPLQKITIAWLPFGEIHIND